MSKAKLAVGAVVGAVAGFVAGLLSAPKSGNDTRAELKNKALKTKDTVVAEVDKVVDLAEKKAKEVKANAENVASDVADKANELKGRAEQALDGAKKGFSKKPVAKKAPSTKSKSAKK